MAGETIEVINNVPFVVMGDGRKIKYADILRYNNPGTMYDDVTLEEIPSAPATPPAYNPGDVKPRQPKPFGQFTADTAKEAWDQTRAIAGSGGAVTNGLLGDAFGVAAPDVVAKAGDYGLAGLNGLLGGISTAVAGGAEGVNAATGWVQDQLGIPHRFDPDTANQKLAGDVMGMLDMLPQMAEGQMIASMAKPAARYATNRAVEGAGKLIADESGALNLPPSVRGLFDEATMREGMIDVPNDPNALDFFTERMRAARDSHGPIGKSVDIYDPEKYAGMRVAMSPDADAGFAVKPDGEVASVVKLKGSPFKDFSGAVLRRAEPDNGYWLNAFDTALTGLYGRGGFRPVSRLPFSEEYARADWGDSAVDAFMAANQKYNGGRPDLVFMVRDPSFNEPVVPGVGGLLTDDYDVATQKLEAELKRLGYR